ncbi:MAG: arsenate reductase ArsC [Candidatus Dadabacteria bacterium]|nr:MAG: arsenate reductase ArsC [Candidatus Dadabacteria bacterium]
MGRENQSRRGILFLCVANSARSQIAEALARRMAPPGTEVYSAGSSPGRLHPLAVRVLAEKGIDASGQYSKPIDAIPRERIGTVITLCAEEVCPVFPGEVERLHWPFEDPAAAGPDEEQALEAFRRVRDAIAARLHEYFADWRGSDSN